MRGSARAAFSHVLLLLHATIARTEPRPPNSDHELGKQGEATAARFLRGEGYKILYRNFKNRHGGEIDLVCRDRDTLVFVEVKTRSSVEFGSPAEAVTKEQKRRISLGGLAWLRMLDNPDVLFRFDIVEVLVRNGKPDCNLIRDAFPLSAPYRY